MIQIRIYRVNEIVFSRLLFSSLESSDILWAEIISNADDLQGWSDNGNFILDSMSPSPTMKIKSAAVLVPIIKRDKTYKILLTKRPENMSEHAGQISFPGGKKEDFDPSPRDTALREAYEEIGLPPENVEVVGCLGNHYVRSGYRITPVVGIVNPKVNFVANPSEVDEIIEVPLYYLLDLRNFRRKIMSSLGLSKDTFIIDYKGHEIWGATAAIIVNLRNKIRTVRQGV
ncbi:MAG: CoA pyrophosphatase [Rhodospirillaceae bacterium]|nr:CoA pyrophosphatase [Alphaproteobacteria bacterium]MBR73045.1 CoA pyrophosphatase [Rhodospirillaceae bacterium]|tara:strand:- start:74 stop:760 length:687 start_codon:yes stop_codon:yes gene_type:complete